MGLLDRLFGKRGYIVPTGDAVRDPANVRGQHYLFAHSALPSLAHARPQDVMMKLLTGHEAFLAGVWAMAGEQAEAKGQAPDRGFKPKVDLRQLREQTAWNVIALPQPRATPEAYFVALGLRTRGAGWDARVYALELGVGGPTLAEWTADGRHLTYGPVAVRLEPQAFLDLCLSDATRPENVVSAS
jgi:hypothetical protein